MKKSKKPLTRLRRRAALIDRAPYGILSTDLSGRVRVCNRAARALLALDSRPATLAAIPDGAALASLSARAVEGQDVEEDITRERDGSAHTLVVLATPRRARDGSIRGAILVLRDVTSRRASQEEARRSHRFLDSIVENIPNMIFIKDAKELRFVLFNKAGEQLLGFRREELIGKNDHDFFPEEQANFFIAKDRKVLADRKLELIPEEPIDTKEGRRVLRTQKIPLLDASGAPEYLLGISEDITRVKEAESKLLHSSRMAALGEMAGGIAHEINNPLTIIHGKARQVRQKLERPEPDIANATRGLEEIETTVMRIAKIIQGLRAFARDAAEDPFTSATLTSIVNDTLEFCRARFAHYKVFLEVKVPPQLSVDCRPVQISQLLLNLLNNALDAVVSLETRWIRIAAGEEGSGIFLSVTDSGPGVPAEIRHKVFQPFFTTKPLGQGTGLGLSIARGIAAAHGGELAVDATSPNTCFVIHLPRKQAGKKAAGM